MDFTHGAINAHNAEIQAVLDQGSFDCATLGDDLTQAWSLTLNVQALTGSDLVKARILDLVRWRGSFATYLPNGDLNPGRLQTFNATDNVLLVGLRVLQTLQGRQQVYTLHKSTIEYSFAVQTDRNIWTVAGVAHGGIDVS
jgi:hypothetical protein